MSEQCGKSETSYCNQPFFPHPIFMPQTTDFADALRRALLQAEISVECVEETGSTSDDLKQRIRERPLAHPVLRTSERQTAGRGTRGKSWKTPRESLLFTLALPYATQGDECVRLPIVVGISVAESLQRLGYPVALKWPNDLWLAGGKTGGILFEQLNGCAVIGIGINVFNDVASIAGEIKDPPARLADLVRFAIGDRWFGGVPPKRAACSASSCGICSTPSAPFPKRPCIACLHCGGRWTPSTTGACVCALPTGAVPYGASCAALRKKAPCALKPRMGCGHSETAAFARQNHDDTFD